MSGNQGPAGGGLLLFDNTHVVAFATQLDGNRAGYGGAVLATFHDSIEFSHGLFLGNIASAGGGGISLYANDRFVLNHCTAQGNWAHYGRFLSNSIPTWDSPFREAAGSVTIRNCIVTSSDNQAFGWSFQGLDLSLTETLDVSHTNIHDEDTHSWYDRRSGVVWGPGNRCVDPQFVDPGHWDLNDTPEDANDDVFILGDYHLKSQGGRWDPAGRTRVIDNVTSPCIDAADPNGSVGLEVSPHGDRLNMGVYGGTVEASLSYERDSPDEPNCFDPPPLRNPGGGGHR